MHPATQTGDLNMQPSPAIYEWTGPTGVQFRQIKEPSGTFYHHDTPREVVSALEAARASDRRLRLFLGDRETGKCWGSELETTGRISRSWGPIKIPILILSSRSSGGGAILDQHIVGIQRAPGAWEYRHPTLELGKWTEGKPESPDYLEAAYCGGQLHAQFKKPGAAERYCAFMRGERWAK